MNNMYKKLLDNCFISKNKTRDITALVRYREGNNNKYYAEVLIMDSMNFRFTLEYVIEPCPSDFECYTTFMLYSSIIANSITFDSITSHYWQETIKSIEQLIMTIFDNEKEGFKNESNEL